MWCLTSKETRHKYLKAAGIKCIQLKENIVTTASLSDGRRLMNTLSASANATSLIRFARHVASWLTWRWTMSPWLMPLLFDPSCFSWLSWVVMSSAQQFETKAELGCGFFSFSSLLRVVMASIGAAREALSSICLSCLIRPNVWIIACRSCRSGVTGFLVHEFFASKTLCFFSIWKAKCDHTA